MLTGYFQERRENGSLVSRIAETEQLLALVPPSPPGLPQQLSTAKVDYTAAREEFPEVVNTTVIIDGILRLAEDTGVKAIPMITQPWTAETAGGHAYPVFRLEVTASGAFTALADFINRLESGEPRTLVIESLVADQVPDAEELFEAKMEIAVFARPAAAFQE